MSFCRGGETVVKLPVEKARHICNAWLLSWHFIVPVRKNGAVIFTLGGVKCELHHSLGMAVIFSVASLIYHCEKWYFTGGEEANRGVGVASSAAYRCGAANNKRRSSSLVGP